MRLSSFSGHGGLGLIGAMALTLAAFCAGACRRQAEPAPEGLRVVSLAPNLTEMICALGGRDVLVGRTSACLYPPDIVRDVPLVGGFGAPSLEMLMALRPTLILDVALESEHTGRKIEALGYRRERIVCRRLQDIPDALIQVGGLVDRAAEAHSLADAMRQRLQEFEQDVPLGRRPSVYVEIWSDPVMTAGKHSFVADLVRLAGGNNIGDEVERDDYFSVSSEWVVARNPDMIISLSQSHRGDAGSAERQIASRSGWDRLDAVREGRVYWSANAGILTSPGPRVLDGLEELRTWIQAYADESR